jgi:hypothetical protein
MLINRLFNKHEPTSRRTFLALCAGVVTAGKAAAARAPRALNSRASTSVLNAMHQGNTSPEVSLKGKLKGGLMGPGGETTGYALTEPRLASNSIEVDMSSIKDARRLDGKDLTVTGAFQTKEYVERGKVLIFKATSVRNASS